MCQPPLYSDSWYPDYHNNRQDTRNDVRHEQVEMSVFLDNARNSYGMQASPSPYYAPPQEQVPFLGGPGYGPIAIPDQPRINLACELITPEQAGDILVPKGKCVNARKHINKVDRRTKGLKTRLWSIISWMVLWLSLIGIFVTMWHHTRLEQLREIASHHPRREEALAEICKQWTCNKQLTLHIPLGICITIIILMHIFILIESIVSDTLKFLENKLSAPEVLANIQAGRQVVPRIQVKIQCSHYSRTSNGISLEKTWDIPVTRCVDASGYLAPEMFTQGTLTRFEIGKELGFLDQESQRKYDELKSALYKRYKKQDDRFSYELVMKFADEEPFSSMQTVYCDGKDGDDGFNWWSLTINYFCYWFCTCICLTWCYRLYHTAATSRLKYTFLKLVEIGDISYD